MKWKPEHTALLVKHYTTKGAGYVAAQLGRTDKQVMAKAHTLGLRVQSTMRNGVPYVIKPKTDPTLFITGAKRGPAMLDGPLIFTDKTRHVVYPSMPQPMRTNTHSSY